MLLLSLFCCLPVVPQTQAPNPRTIQDASAKRMELDIRKLVSFGTRNTLSSTTDTKRGIGAARRWLHQEFSRISRQYHGDKLQVELQHFLLQPGPRIPHEVDLANVVATLPGTDSNRLIVVSGHYDSIASSPTDANADAPGANDDASGVAAVLEAARLLGGLQPRATIVFLAVAGEEQGLYGSRKQAELWKQQGKEVVAMITLDIVGGVKGSSGKQEPMRVRVFSEGMPSAGPRVVGSTNDAPSRQLARYIKRSSKFSQPDFELSLVFRQDRFSRGGDHKPFNDLGWAAIRLTEPHENYHWQHQNVRQENGIAYGDLPEHVDFAFTARVAQSVASATHELALAPAAPKNVRVDIQQLSPHTTLRWELGAEKDLAGYAVLIRPTDAADWTQRKLVGKNKEVTLLALSKDDYLFAVEAIDQQGNRSLPIYPTPQR